MFDDNILQKFEPFLKLLFNNTKKEQAMMFLQETAENSAQAKAIFFRYDERLNNLEKTLSEILSELKKNNTSEQSDNAQDFLEEVAEDIQELSDDLQELSESEPDKVNVTE